MSLFRSRALIMSLAALALVGLVSVQPDPQAKQRGNPPESLPQFTGKATSDWINSEPLAVEDLRGDVVLVDIWTYECWNCYRSIPWLHSLEKTFADTDFRIVGIHTPEFEREKRRANVLKKVEEFGITHPVMMDNDFAYWNALGNRYWPAFYLVDRKGRIRGLFIGETHAGDRRAQEIESAIETLLAES